MLREYGVPAAKVENLDAERVAMKCRMALIIGIILVCGCGENTGSTHLASEVGPSSAQGVGGDHRHDGVVEDSPYTHRQIKAAIKETGGRWISHQQRISFSGTQITDSTLEYVNWIPRVEKLSVKGTQISDAGLEYISGQIHMLELDLADTQITDAGLKHLRKLARLRSLGLAGTRITDAAIEELAVLPELKMLDVSDTQITHGGLVNARILPQLEIVHISTSRFTDADLEELASALPTVRIMSNP